MERRWLATTALLLLSAAAAAEPQLDYGVRSQAGWTDNVYATPEDASITSLGETVDLPAVDDYSVRVSPWAQISEPDGNLTGSLRYQPAYEYYVSERDLRGLDHDATAQLVWRAGTRTSIFLTDSFRQYRSLLRFNENAGSLLEPAVLRGRRDEVEANSISLGVRRLLSPRDELTLSTAYSYREYESAPSNDLDNYSLATRWKHTLSGRTSIGLAGSWLRQNFARGVGEDAISDFYNLSGTAEHWFTRSLHVEIEGGPAVIDNNSKLSNSLPRIAAQRSNDGSGGGRVVSQALGCRRVNGQTIIVYGLLDFGCLNTAPMDASQMALLGYPPGQPPTLTEFGDPLEFDAGGNLVPVDDSAVGDPELTYFARASLIKDWERWRAELVYERSADESGSFGGSSVRDALDLGLRWQAAQLWTLNLNTGIQLLEQASEAAIPVAAVVRIEPAPPGTTVSGVVLAVQQPIVNVDDSALSYQYLYVSLTATRQLTNRASAFATIYYYDQEQDLDPSGAVADTTTRWNNVTLWFGIDWQFETIRF